MEKCNLCKNKEATKTGSHIVPSFLMKRINALDNCGKRDYEVGLSYRGLGFNLYIGRNIDQDKLGELISSSQDEFIEKNVNQDVKDYIFCPDCEAHLGKIESEYAKTLSKYEENNNVITHNVKPNVALIFWASIVWRIAFTEEQNLGISEEFKNHLGSVIKNYIDCVKKGKDTGHLIRNSELHYKLFRCVDYSKTEATHLFLEENKNVVTLICDEYILILYYKSESKKDEIDLLGAENYLDKIKFNTGLESEEIYSFSKEEYKEIMTNLITKFARRNRTVLFELFRIFHDKTDFFPNYKDEFYPLFEEFYYIIANNKEKTGEQYIDKTYIKAFLQVAKNHPEVYGNFSCKIN